MAEKIIPKKTMKGIRFYNVSDLAKILNITELSARVYLRQNKISGVKVGRRWYIREKSLNDFLLCKGIRNMPDDEMVKMINKAVEIKFSEWTEKAIPLMQKVVTEFLIKKEKEKFKVNIKKVEEKNKELEKVLPGKVIQKLRYRETKIKKDFEKVK
ncbi:hypothetical protein ES705_06267 [subsurface metagenome]